MDATAEKMTASVNSKTSADELLREDLEVWSKEIGDNIADEIVKRVLRATDGALEKIDTHFCDQLEQQGETLKKVNDQSIDLKKRFEQFFIRYGWKEVVFWAGLGLFAASSGLSIFLICKLAGMVGLIG